MPDRPAPVILPLIARSKDGWIAHFGASRLRLSRAGGMLEWLDEPETFRFGTEIKVVLATPAGPVRIRQSRDTDPRLLVVEQGPVRYVLRAQFDLLDEEGLRWGEGLAEWTAYPDGDVAGVVSLRLINADRNALLVWAGLQWTGVGCPASKIAVADDSPAFAPWDGFAAFDDTTAGLLFRPAASDPFVVAWRSGKSVAYVGGKGPWQDCGDVNPYYEDWGVLPDQGWGESGWAAGSGAGVACDAATGCAEMAFLRSQRGEPLPPVSAWQGALRILPVTDSDIAGVPAQGGERGLGEKRSALASAVASWRSPTALSEVSGARYRGYGVYDAAHMIYAPAARHVEIVIPPSPEPTTLHVYGLTHWGGWIATCADAPMMPQLINDGLSCDDPNGLQIGRFDDRHGPVLGRTDTSANRMILRAQASDKSRKIILRAVEGLGLSYLHWDDRQTYLVQSSANTRRNLAEIAVRDGKLRRLVAPRSDEVSVAAIPLYWYQCNATTPYAAVDDLVRWTLVHAGPAAVEFEVHARNRYGCADGHYRVGIPFHDDIVRVDTRAELVVRKKWRVGNLQLLNLFAEEFRDHHRWPHEFALARDRSGQFMVKRPREGTKTVVGERFIEYEPPIFFAHYTARRGNVFLVQADMDGPVRCHHFLCPHWIDSHYHIVRPTGEWQAGDRVRGSYALVVDAGRLLDTEEVAKIADAVVSGVPLAEALASGDGKEA